MYTYLVPLQRSSQRKLQFEVLLRLAHPDLLPQAHSILPKPKIRTLNPSTNSHLLIRTQPCRRFRQRYYLYPPVEDFRPTARLAIHDALVTSSIAPVWNARGRTFSGMTFGEAIFEIFIFFGCSPDVIVHATRRQPPAFSDADNAMPSQKESDDTIGCVVEPLQKVGQHT